MDGKRSWKKTDEVEVDLTDLLRMLCMRWKQIAACALVFAVLAGGYGYLKNRGNGQEPDILLEEAELTEDEMLAVEDAVQLFKETEGLQEYLDHSILMQADPYQKAKVISLYSIEKASGREKAKITESYLNCLTSGGAAGALKRADSKAWGMDAQYLAEAVTAWQKTDGSFKAIIDGESGDDPEGTLFYVETVGTDEKMAGQMAEGIQAALKKYSKEVKETCGEHVLVFVGSQSSTIIDSGLETQQHDKRERLKSYRASLQSAKDALSGQQKAVYDTEIGKQDAALPQDTEAEAAESSFSVTYLIFGCAAGILIYSALFAVWYLLQDTVKSAAEFQACYNLPFYGMVSLKKGKKQDIQEKEKERIVSRIRIACEKQGISRICLAADFQPAPSERLCLESMAKKLREWEIDAVSAEDANQNAAMWDMAAEVGTVLLVCRIGSSTHQMVDGEMAFYQENGIRVLGAALLESDAR